MGEAGNRKRKGDEKGKSTNDPILLPIQNHRRRLLRHRIRDGLRMRRDVQRGDREVDDADVGGAVDAELGGDDAVVGAGAEGGGADWVISV
jgi:hypothetical protein